MLFQFNEYSSLLLPSFIQGVLFFILLLYRGFVNNRLADKLLALILLIYTLQVASWMLGFAGWYDVRDWHTSFMFYFQFNHWLAIGPLFYLYFLSITNYEFKWERRHWLHFIPAGIWVVRWFSIFFMDVVIDHWINGNPFPHFHNTHGDWLDNGWGFFDKIWMFLEPLTVIFYVVMTLRLFKQYQQYIVEYFSDTGSIHFKWLRNILIAMIIGFLTWIGFDIAGAISEEGLSYIEDWYSFFFLGLLIYYLSIEGYTKGAIDRPQMKLHFEPEKENIQTEMVAPNEELINWKKKIEVYINEEKPYLQSDISLSQLAAALQTSSAVLSKTINMGFEKNFNEFINTYRVEELKKKLSNPEYAHLTLLANAMDSGFSSKATFNRVFKKLEGVSPSEYLKTVIGN